MRASPPPITVKVATLNTKLGGESPWNPSEQIAVLAAEQPDVVLLQEALYLQLDQYRNGIGAALHDGGWSGSYARHCERGAAPTCDKYGAESVMVLTRLPIADSDARLIWARDRTWAARGVVRVAVRVADGVVQIVSCHLPAGPIATRARLHWVAEFSKWAAGLQQPQIVGGDFNDTPASRPVAAMKAGYADAWSAAGGRIGGTEAPDDMTYMNRYDYLFSSGGLEIKSVSIPPVKISDHRPVVATYRLGRK